MGKLALTSLPLVSIFIILMLLDFRVNATFFIEVHENDGYQTSISLYECNLPNSSQPTPQSDSSAIALLPPPTINQDITCNEVKDKRKKKQIYSTTNFYIVFQPQLSKRRQIVLGSRSQLPSNIFVGITVVSEGPADSPVFYSDLNADNFNSIRHKCTAGLHADFLSGENIEGFVNYMNLANIHQFARVSDGMVYRFNSFTAVVDNVLKYYMENVVFTKQKGKLLGDAAAKRQRRAQNQLREEAKTNVKTAARLLIHKLLDPCFVVSYLLQTGQQLPTRGTGIGMDATADTMCKNHCLLLSAALTLSSVRSAVCGSALSGGSCVRKKCMCEKISMKFLCVSGNKFVPMVACSNDLRMLIKNFLNFGV